ncbi:LacI family DNA-binding transcriptional regulator [Sulfitobacter sp. F26204]|uniref:LacI family DNA-binding transcriptional regulator n=1 Tax=Sulfitobacter sp. F26204 TaxID=2996014 RepID=UPI00225E4EFC|nr:LacI family DNA-binding transcriptional regulator [Sulfitobacter sp. F26204]MCX7561706.1 LacI family DNA-binding transcriptional regulator [Sulfitobacter sp. F26204]
MRPTTKDLAKAAGVSLATVDRVLNGRSGVREKTVKAVNAAILRIGFERNQVAATLARQRAYRFAFALPRFGDEFLDEIIDRIREFDRAGRAEMVEVDVIRLDDHDPHRAARTLSRLSAEDLDGVAIMAPGTPQIRDAILRMRERGIRTIPFIANQQLHGDEGFVGIYNRGAGATAGRLMGRFLGRLSGSIAVLTETTQSRDSLERRLGFDGVINRDYSNLKILPTLETHGDPGRTQHILRNALHAHRDIVGLYFMGAEARVPIEVSRVLTATNDRVAIAHERTPSTEHALKTGELDAVIHQDPGHLVRSAVRILRAKCENRTTLASQERIRTEILIAENI